MTKLQDWKTREKAYVWKAKLCTSCVVMATLRSRCRHYILQLWFLSYFFFPHLFSAVGYWMSTILPHMMWP